MRGLRCLPALIMFVSLTTLSAGGEPRVYTDEDYGFRMSVPDAWKRANPAGMAVPGEVCRSWSSGNGAMVVVFIQKSPKVYSAQFLADQTASGMEKIGCKVDHKKVEVIGGLPSMRVVVTGNGTGLTLDGKGKIKTSQEWIAIPRGGEIVLLLLTAPESGFSTAQEGFSKAISTLEIEAAVTK